jgi:hypothetical protein
VVGGRAFGDGDAAFGDHAGRNDRTGVFGRNAVYPVLLRFAAGDGHFVHHAVPFFYRAKVYTAYEYLEKRFDAKTRSLTSFFFLISRGLGVGVVIAAPSVILSIVLGWSEVTTIFVMGLSTTFYTMVGGVQAVTWTDVKANGRHFLRAFRRFFIIISSFRRMFP